MKPMRLKKHKNFFLAAAALSFLTGAGSCQNKTLSAAESCFGNQSQFVPEISDEPCAGRESGAFGIVLEFKEWPPGGGEAAPLAKRLNEEGLRDMEKFQDFQSCSFHWPRCGERDQAEEICGRLMSEFASLLKSCSPDNYLEPA